MTAMTSGANTAGKNIQLYDTGRDEERAVGWFLAVSKYIGDERYDLWCNHSIVEERRTIQWQRFLFLYGIKSFSYAQKFQR